MTCLFNAQKVLEKSRRFCPKTKLVSNCYYKYHLANVDVIVCFCIIHNAGYIVECVIENYKLFKSRFKIVKSTKCALWS